MRFRSETFVFKFLRRSVEGKHLMRFQSETFVFKFLRCRVDGAEHTAPLSMDPSLARFFYVFFLLVETKLKEITYLQETSR